MNVKHSFADRLIVQRRGKSLERPPVFGVRPLLVRIQLVEIGHYWIPRFNQRVYALAREPYPIRGRRYNVLFAVFEELRPDGESHPA
jgi:hypothetical protein